MAALKQNLILALACASALIYGITCKPVKRSATDCYGTDCIIPQDELDFRSNPRDTVLLENITVSLNHAFPEIVDLLKSIGYIHQNATATALPSIAQSLDDDKHLQASQNILIENGTAVTTPILLEMVRLMQNQQAMQERMLHNITTTATATLTTLKRVADLLEDQAERQNQERVCCISPLPTAMHQQEKTPRQNQDSVSSISPLPTAVYQQEKTPRQNQDSVSSISPLPTAVHQEKTPRQNQDSVSSISPLPTVHQQEKTPDSCLGLSSGQHTILPNNTELGSFPVVCDMDTDSGGWIVFQRRFNGSVDFDRTWDDYETGFGSLDGEFWLGLRKLHVLTSRGRWELRVDLGDFDGNRAYAIYDDFSIGDSASFYRLEIGSYSGTAGDSMRRSVDLDGMAFTTKDQDHDTNRYGNCAIYAHGGWWFRFCSSANLNGLYLGPASKSFAWYHWKNSWEPLKESELKIRLTDG